MGQSLSVFKPGVGLSDLTASTPAIAGLRDDPGLALPATPPPPPLPEPPIGLGAALARARGRSRESLPFRAVNRREAPDYDPGLQRHHLLPRQLLGKRCFGPLFDLMGRDRIGFEDFRSNGLLLPASDAAARRIGLPLHRGPHHDYNALVMERVGQVEAGWSRMRLLAPELALNHAVGRLKLLQRALRRRLLDPGRKRLALSRHDPLAREVDFSELDRMADSLWGDTQQVVAEAHPEDISLILRPAQASPAGGTVFLF